MASLSEMWPEVLSPWAIDDPETFAIMRSMEHDSTPFMWVDSSDHTVTSLEYTGIMVSKGEFSQHSLISGEIMRIVRHFPR